MKEDDGATGKEIVKKIDKKSTQNYYERLGIKTDATPQEIRDACNKRFKQFHSDKSQDQMHDHRISQVKQVRDTLLDPVKRRKYDEKYKIKDRYIPLGETLTELTDILKQVEKDISNPENLEEHAKKIEEIVKKVDNIKQRHSESEFDIKKIEQVNKQIETAEKLVGKQKIDSSEKMKEFLNNNKTVQGYLKNKNNPLYRIKKALGSIKEGLSELGKAIKEKYKSAKTYFRNKLKSEKSNNETMTRN